MEYPVKNQIYRSELVGPESGQGNANNASGGNGGIKANGASQPLHVISGPPTGDTKYWCKELNGLWKCRTTNDIMNNCQPGNWRVHPQTRFPYFVRTAAG